MFVVPGTATYDKLPAPAAGAVAAWGDFLAGAFFASFFNTDAKVDFPPHDVGAGAGAGAGAAAEAVLGAADDESAVAFALAGGC